MHFGQAVELWDASLLLKASFKIGILELGEFTFVFGDEIFELVANPVETCDCVVCCQLEIGFGVRQVVPETAGLVSRAFQYGRSEILVCGKDDEVL